MIFVLNAVVVTLQGVDVLQPSRDLSTTEANKSDFVLQKYKAARPDPLNMWKGTSELERWFSMADFFWGLKILLMVQKSQGQPPFGCFWNLVNNEINHQPQLVIAGSLKHQLYFSKRWRTMTIIYNAVDLREI